MRGGEGRMTKIQCFVHPPFRSGGCAVGIPEPPSTFWIHPPGPWKGRFKVAGAESPHAPAYKNKKGESLKILPFALERKTGRALALRASDSRILADTPGLCRVPSCTGIRKEGRTFRLLPSSGAENGFPTQAYSSFTISALREVFSSKVTLVMRSSCTRLHPNAFDKDTNYFHTI